MRGRRRSRAARRGVLWACFGRAIGCTPRYASLSAASSWLECGARGRGAAGRDTPRSARGSARGGTLAGSGASRFRPARASSGPIEVAIPGAGTGFGTALAPASAALRLRFFAIVQATTLALRALSRPRSSKTLDRACPRPLNWAPRVFDRDHGARWRPTPTRLRSPRAEHRPARGQRRRAAAQQRLEAPRAHRAQGRALRAARPEEHERHVRERPQDHAPLLVGPGDKIYIGDFILSLQDSPNLQAEQRRLRERPATQPVASLRPGVGEPLVEPGLGAPGAGLEQPGMRRSGLPPPPPPPSDRPPAVRTAPPPPPPPLVPAEAQAPRPHPRTVRCPQA